MSQSNEYRSAENFLYQTFAKVVDGNADYSTWSDMRKASEGARIFKRKALGLCGQSTDKSLDEVAGLLLNLKMAGSKEEAMQLVPSLVDAFNESTCALSIGSSANILNIRTVGVNREIYQIQVFKYISGF